MLNFFKSRPVLSVSDFNFQIDAFKWLMKNFGGKDFYDDTYLVLPTNEFFPSEVTSKEEVATEIFLQVKKYAGLEDWPCELVAQKESIDPVVGPNTAIVGAPSSPHGTFSWREDEVKITYDPDLIMNPSQLVATFAHELSHYLISTSVEDPPGGWDNWEFVTDITAVFIGFGVFMANTAVEYSNSFKSGGYWNSLTKSGYLSEREFVFALAIFTKLKSIDSEEVVQHLKRSLRKMYYKSINELENKTEIIKEIKSIEYIGEQ